MTGAVRKLPDRFAEAPVDDEIVLMDTDTGRFLSLRGSAATIWSLIDGETDRDALIERLLGIFDGQPAAIAADLDALIDQLRQARFVA